MLFQIYFVNSIMFAGCWVKGSNECVLGLAIQQSSSPVSW